MNTMIVASRVLNLIRFLMLDAHNDAKRVGMYALLVTYETVVMHEHEIYTAQYINICV